MTATPNLFYVYDFNGTGGEAVEYIPASGGIPTSEGDTSTSSGELSGLAIDSVSGVYFVTAFRGSDDYIYEEHFGQAPTFSPLGGGPISTNDTTGSVTSLALNTADDILYFTKGTGFFEEKFSGADYSGTPTLVQLATLPNTTTHASQQIAFDAADHSAYFAAPVYKHGTTLAGSSHGTTHLTTASTFSKNYIYKVSGVASSAAANSLSGVAVNLGGPNGELPHADGAITAITLDTATDTLFIATKSGGVSGTNTAGIYAYNIGTSTLSTVWSETVTSSTQSLTDINNITIDPTTGAYYVSDGDTSKHPGIYTGSVSSNAAPTPLYAPTEGAASNGDETLGLAIDLAPTITSVAVTAIDGNAGKTTGTLTTADTATVSVNFSQNMFVSGAPKLTLNDGGSATYSSGSGSSTLVFTYTPSSGQNTSTLATTGAESNGTIADSAGTAVDLANLAHSFTGVSVQTTAPTLSTTGASGDAIQGGAAKTLLQSDAISDPNGSGNLTQATITITDAQAGDGLSILGLSGGTVDGGLVSVSGVGTSTLTLSGSASVSEYQTLLTNVTYQDAGSDTTTAGHPTRTLDWTVNDGVLASNVASSTVTIDRAPTVTAGATVNYAGNGPPVVADSSLTTSDSDADQLQGATVQISSGFLSGDVLATGPGLSANIKANYDSSTGTLTLSGADTPANYQAALESVTYSYTGADVTGGGTDVSRTLTWTTSDGFTTSSPAASTVDVTPCFCSGSLILTERGEVAVEELQPGDLVMTVSGAWRPVVWLGRRAVHARFANPLRVWPIRVKAGALGENSPRRDLRLSPDHALFVGGVLIHAGALVNGTSIVRESRVPEIFDYYHVELEDHDLIWVEGAPAETFVDNIERMAFDNWAEHEALYPEGKPVHELMHPRAKSHRQVPTSIRASLEARAHAIGAALTAVA